MNLLRKLRYLSPAYRRTAERDMQEEMNALAGIAGRAELGNLTLAAENARAAWGWTWLEGIWGDLKYAIRTLARQRSFAAVAVLSLALGIGANAAIFSLMDALLWRDLPVRNPENLVLFGNNSRSYFGYTRFAEGSGGALDGVIASSGLEHQVDAGGGAQRGLVQLVSGNFFQVLGVSAALGRPLIPDDDHYSAPARVAVLGYDYWRRAFAGDPSTIGRTIHVEKAAYRIVGVASEGFFGLSVGEVPDVWVPVTTLPAIVPGDSWLDGKNNNFLTIAGRLKSGVTRQRAAGMLTPLSIQIDLERGGSLLTEADRRELLKEKLELTPASEGASGLRGYLSKPLRAIFWMVAIGLLLACANVMSLQFARADERRRELTVRLAIGASRFRIARQLLAESLLIGAAAGALGLALVQPAARGLAGMVNLWGDQPLRLVVPLNSSLLLFVTAISLAAAVISGVGPALRATRGDIAPGLQLGGRAATAAPTRRSVGRAVTVLQLALSLVLISGTCLFAYNLHRLRNSDSGIRRERLLVVDIDPGAAGYKDAAAVQLNLRLRERLASIPGVEAVSFTQNGLYSGRNYDTGFDADGFPRNAPGRHHSIYDHVGPNFFSTAGAHMVAGRDFNERDQAGAPNVAILSQSLARRVFKDRSPVGLNLYIGGKEKTAYQIVGVVADLRGNVRNPTSMFYLCQLQSQVQGMSTRLLIRTRRDPAPVMAAMRPAVREVDPALSVSEIVSADDLFDRTVDRDRLLATLAWGFGILALTLAAVGIYGLLSYDVARRTGEFGIRMAIGARKSNIMALVLREVALVGAAGLAIGALTAAELSRLVEGMVFGFKPGDPRVIAAAALVLLGIALMAALIPARRAAAMDPMRALRCE